VTTVKFPQSPIGVFTIVTCWLVLASGTPPIAKCGAGASSTLKKSEDEPLSVRHAGPAE
jgi:hypothetical protein